MKFEKLLSECCEYEGKKVSIASAKYGTKTRYEFKPNGPISKICFDKCNMGHVEKCDFLFMYEKDKVHLIFLELKDSDLVRAVAQIKSTVDIIKSSNNIDGKDIHARIVLTKVVAPDIRDSRVVKFRKKIESANGSFEFKSQKMIETILK